MLSLDSPAWSNLCQAHGAADCVPKYLRALAAEPVQGDESALWIDLSSMLCHQGTVYTGTYAAIPHLVEIASHLAPTDQAPYVCFVGATALCTNVAEIPEELAQAHAKAVTRAEAMARNVLHTTTPDDLTVVYVLAAIAAFHGCVDTAGLVEGIAQGEYLAWCPRKVCGVEVVVSIEGAKMVAIRAASVAEPGALRRAVEPPAHWPPPDSTSDWNELGARSRLYELALQAGHADIAHLIRLLDGAAICPQCDVPFPLGQTVLNTSEF